MGWEAVVPIASSVISGISGADAAKSAAGAQTGAVDAATAEQRRQYDQTRADYAPFRETGLAANARLAQLMQPGGDLARRFTAQDLANDPVYNSGLQFGLDQGTGAINARALAGGSYDSGATLKALTKYANDYGSTKANESYNRFNTDMTNLYNRNAGLSGAGQTATGSVASAGQNAANNISDLNTQAGNARAAGIVGESNAWGNALGQANNAYQNYQNNQMLKTWLSSP